VEPHEPNIQPSIGSVQPDADRLKLQMTMQQLRDNQNYSMAILGGSVAAIVGAVLWAVVTALTKWQIGFMAIGVGFLVGFAVRKMGQGVSVGFGVIGAVLSLIGCLLGNYLAVCAIYAAQQNIGIFDVLGQVDFQTGVRVMIDSFHPMDVLFYVIAIYYGYKYSFHVLTADKAASVSNP